MSPTSKVVNQLQLDTAHLVSQIPALPQPLQFQHLKIGISPLRSKSFWMGTLDIEFFHLIYYRHALHEDIEKPSQNFRFAQITKEKALKGAVEETPSVPQESTR